MNIKEELQRTQAASLTLSEQEKAAIRTRIRQKKEPRLQKGPIAGMVLLTMIGILLFSPLVVKNDAQNQGGRPEPIADGVTRKLTEAQKHHYYEQYKEILREQNELKIGLDDELVPFEDFSEKSWVTPGSFKKRVQDNIQDFLETERKTIAAVSSIPDPIRRNADGSITKKTYFYIPDIVVGMAVTADIETQYDILADRQIITGVKKLTAQPTESKRVWEQKRYKSSINQNGDAVRIEIEGIIQVAGVSKEKKFTIEFHCDKNGKIE